MSFRYQVLFLVLFACFAGQMSAQSGRAKPSPSPTPRVIAGPSVVYMPTQAGGDAGPKISPTPTPTPNAKDADVIKVESALVPIPVSVTDERGRAVTTLKLADFELKIDGRTVEIDELARSETPIRLAMLFEQFVERACCARF